MKDMFIALWFFLPAGIGNMAPIGAARFPGLRNLTAPIDCGKTFRGGRLLGAHKTWRGLLSGIFFAVLTLWGQQVLVTHVAWLSNITASINYPHLPIVLLGILFGFGALGGDAVKSFFKRRAGVLPGRSWFPFDQIDYIVGSALATSFIVRLTVAQYVWAVVLGLFVHLGASYAGYLAHFKDRPI
ncbi:MAG TPA: CDP-archaeol synthase [Patescibacteria group bacterium]|nr:CDP-archaeol synthase [Patescibacteria group bacterium]